MSAYEVWLTGWPTLAFRHSMQLLGFKVCNMYIPVFSGLLPVRRGDGESTEPGEGDLEATRVSGRRPKLERSRMEVANMEETTYSTILPLNSTLLSVVPGSVPAPPPPPPNRPPVPAREQESNPHLLKKSLLPQLRLISAQP